MRARYISLFLIVILTGFTANAFSEFEFLVNNRTYADQYYPDVVMDPSGNFVVAWTSADQDGDGLGIFARRFGSDGTSTTIGDVQVNTTTTGDQYDSSIAMNSIGNYVIVWTGTDANRAGIFAQIYNNEGFPLGGEFQVNVTTDNDQYAPYVVMDSTGNFFLIVWTSVNQDTGDSRGIYAKLYNTDGSIVKDEFLVNTYTANDQRYPAAAMDSSGNFIITWGSNGQDGDGYGVYAKIFDNTGAVKKEEFLINTYTESYQLLPAVTMDADGDFIITWASYEQDDYWYGVYAKIYSKFGEVIKDEFPINIYTDNQQYYSAIALDDDGNFVITWQSFGQDGSDSGIYARGFDNTGTPLGREFQVNSYALDSQNRPEIAMNGDGSYVIVYRSGDQVDADSGYDIFARLLNISDTPPADLIPPHVEILSPENGEIVYGVIDIVINAADESSIQSVEIQLSGGVWNQCLFSGEDWRYNIDTSGFIAMPLEIQARATDGSENANIAYSSKITPIIVNPDDFEEFRVNTTITGNQSRPAIAMGVTGDFIVVWDSNGIFARRFDITGNPISDEFQISTDRAGSRPSVAMDAEGNFTVAWQNQVVFVRQFDNTGNPLGKEFGIAFGSNPVIAMNDSGDFTVTWNLVGYNGGASAIYGRSFYADGTSKVGEFEVFPDTNCSEQAIAMKEDGGFIITGTILNEDETNSEVFALNFESDGIPSGIAIQVNTYENSFQSKSSIAIDPNGNFIIAWQSAMLEEPSLDIYAQLFDNSGNFVGDEFRVNSSNIDNQGDPQVAVDARGNFIVVWDDSFNGGEKRNVLARTFDNTAQPVEKFQVNSDVLASDDVPTPVVAMNIYGSYAVAWYNLGDIYARVYEAPEYDLTPPQVEIVYPVNGSWASGIVPFEIMANDENSVMSVEIQFNDGEWLTCLSSGSSWRYDFDTAGLLNGSEVKVLAQATDNSENANVGYTEMFNLPIVFPTVEINFTGGLSRPGDMLDIRVDVLNTRFGNLELYVACLNSGNLFWFPLWNDTPNPTTIDRGKWKSSILTIPYAFRPKGTFIFYAALVAPESIECLDLTSLEFRLE